MFPSSPWNVAQYLDLHDNQEVTGPFRLGWVLSYPSPQYAMEPIYTTGKSSNYANFSNDEFDSLIAEADASDPRRRSERSTSRLEDILLEEMPVIPMSVPELRCGALRPDSARFGADGPPHPPSRRAA